MVKKLLALLLLTIPLVTAHSIFALQSDEIKITMRADFDLSGTENWEHAIFNIISEIDKQSKIKQSIKVKLAPPKVDIKKKKRTKTVKKRKIKKVHHKKIFVPEVEPEIQVKQFKEKKTKPDKEKKKEKELLDKLKKEKKEKAKQQAIEKAIIEKRLENENKQKKRLKSLRDKQKKRRSKNHKIGF